MNEKKLLELMLEHQDRLNSQIHPEWRKQHFPWHRAIWMECAELMDCFPWKWWAKGEVDWDNVKIELADLWHFILSWCLQDEQKAEFLVIFPKLYSEVQISQGSVMRDTPSFWIENLVSAAIQGSLERVWISFLILLRISNLDLNDLARIYFGKNVLNRFRQKHGLKEGRYSRLWNDIEDNKVMLRLIEGLDVLPLERFEAELSRRLEEEYAEAG